MTMIKNSVDIITLDCSKNLVDSETIDASFSRSGYKVRHDPEKVSSEFVEVNTLWLHWRCQRRIYRNDFTNGRS